VNTTSNRRLCSKRFHSNVRSFKRTCAFGLGVLIVQNFIHCGSHSVRFSKTIVAKSRSWGQGGGGSD
jgi:hypothetical protein